MSCGADDPSLRQFVDIQARLKNFVQVPKLFCFDFKKGFLLLEDLGDISLEHVFLNGDKKLQLSLYQQALKQLIELQSQVLTLESDPVFDQSFFLNEIEKNMDEMNKYLHGALKHSPIDRKLLKNFKKEMEQILSHFHREDYVYCHRDYHSRNLMIKENQVLMIDFQDAGKGPWYYDLSSLLYDCYVSLQNREELAQFYFENLNSSLKQKAQSLKHVHKMMKLMFLQRGFKACGRFCAFKNKENKDTHLKYLKPVVSLLKSTAEELSYPAISAGAHFLIQALN